MPDGTIRTMERGMGGRRRPRLGERTTRLGVVPTPFGAVVFPLVLALAIAACAPSAVPTPSGSSASVQPSSASTEASSAPPSDSGSPSAGASTPAPTSTARPSANAFWTAVGQGLATAGHLVLTAKGASPVTLRFLPKSSAALVAGDTVSICVAGASWQGASGHFANVSGTWMCGAEALVAGFRATGGPIDAWNPDFPPGGTISEKVSVTSDGRWRWTFAGRGTLEGDVDASLLLDPVSRRLVGGSRTGELGKTTFSFDYAAPVAPIVAPG